ncbi:hypothetical protein RSOLAG1IB_03655 [Rhizoctonia solani AG-1 IB]|uniref:Uncharacterized protein n=1 Tax=Thanatephorus cucumeris (strain AG1-IB / isolate 7/3/14) TaxID=1108050 RepID=A0A0B7FU72_THACB|nr:hypothetical protein RSOLAG1IB_03655 [Rhizoctonia solani AG-1 IB]
MSKQLRVTWQTSTVPSHTDRAARDEGNVRTKAATVMLTLASPYLSQYTIKYTNPTGLFTPPSSPYAMAGYAPSSTSGALSQQTGTNGCKMGSTACPHSEKDHQPRECRCGRGLNIFCKACRAFCYTHGC